MLFSLSVLDFWRWDIFLPFSTLLLLNHFPSLKTVSLLSISFQIKTPIALQVVAICQSSKY